MIEILFAWLVLVAILYAIFKFAAWHSSHSSLAPPLPIPEFKPRPKVVPVPDKKQRREFRIFYVDGTCRGGVLYREGNIMMNDGELFSRLDQLVDKRVVGIGFDENINLFKPTVVISER